MQGKKRYFVIALFLLIGLTTFTFANPEEELGSQKKSSGQSEKIENDKKVNKSYSEALEAVKKAEENPTLETVETARTEIQNANDATEEQVQQLQNRVEVVENTVDVAALVAELETLVSVKETIDDASIKYPNAETEVNKLNEGDVKNNLETRLLRVEKIINDTTNPTYTGITNNQITNENVSINVTDETEVIKTVTLNNEKVDFKEMFEEEGTYVVTLTDEAFNETTVTFTIDKTKPKFDGLKSGSHYETIEVLVDDENATIIVKNMDTNESTEVTNGTVLTEDATYYITAEDAAGNKTSIWVAIDTTAPSITGVDEEKPTNKNEIVYVSDKFLMTVTIDGTEYTRDDFTAENNNENFKFQKKVTKEGTHTVVATDKFGNQTTKTFVIDKTPNKIMWTSLKTTNSYVDGNVYYAKNGDTITFRMGTSEKIGKTPVVTIGGKEVTMEYVKYFAGPKHHEYIGTLEIPTDESEMVEGNLEISISNITDEAGNEGFVYQKGEAKEIITKTVTTNGKSIIYDRTSPVVSNVTIRGGNGIWEDGKYTYYAKEGTTIYLNAFFKEELAEKPLFKLNGSIEVPVKTIKYTENNNMWNYSTSYKLTAEDKLADGLIQVEVSGQTDKAGNTNVLTNADMKLDSQSRVIIDRTAPVIEVVGVPGRSGNEYRIESGTEISVEDVLATVIDENIDEKSLKPYKADLLIGKASQNTYNYDFSNGFNTKHVGRYNIYYEVKDKAGNKATNGLLLIMKDTTAPTIVVKGTEGRNNNELRVSQDDVVTLADVSATVTDNAEEDKELAPVEIRRYYPKETGKASHIYDATSGFDTSIPGYYALKYEAVDSSNNKSTKTMLLVVKLTKSPEVIDGVANLYGNLTLTDTPFYNNDTSTEDVVINGNGYTVTQKVTDASKFDWRENYTIPLMADVFSSSNGSKTTLNDITLKGTIQSVLLGNYEKTNQGNFSTEFNNVNIVGTEVVSLSANISPGAFVYGKAVLNNTNIYGTKLSPLDTDPMWTVYDLAVGNYSDTTINNGKYGSIYTWAKAYLEINNAEVDTIISQIRKVKNDFDKGELLIGAGTKVNKIIIKNEKAVVTIKSGAEVGTLDLSAYDTTNMTITIENGATVKKVITKDGEMPFEEWEAQINYTTVNSVEEFKSALTAGYRKIIIASTLEISENQKLSATKKTFVTTQGTITMFNVKEGKSLTLKNLVLDGENKYKVDVTKASETHNDPYNIFNKYPLEQTRIYENTPLITSAGTLKLGSGTVIRNYAHQPVNGTNKQQYGGPAILVTGGETVINGLEFTNNVSQLLTAKNATITIDNINVHDTWADGNKAGLIEINTGATMDVNNGTFKNNMMSMRSYGLFIANAGTINMKGGLYENNQSTRNGGNTAGSLFGVESTGKIYMTGGTIQNNIGYRAGAFATRWATDGSVIELNGGTIKNNTTRSADFKNAGVFVQSHVKVGKDMVVEDKVVLRGATAILDNNGKIAGDVELVDNSCTFNNNGSVTGTIIKP